MARLRVKRIILLSIIFFLFVSSISFLYFRNKYDEIIKTPEEPYSIKEIYESITKQEENENPKEIDNVLSEKIIEERNIELSAWTAYWDFYSALDTYKSHTDKFHSLSPTWYFQKADGALGLKNTSRNNELRELCINNHTKLIPSISNSNAENLSTVLNDEEILNNHINIIVTEVIDYGYDGIDIDYEYIKAGDRERFSYFINQLADQLHKNGKILTIAILWKNNLEEVIEEFSDSRAAQDWESIGGSVDEFRIMAYDFTGSSDMAGPIAPQNWIESILAYALSKVPKDKIVLGMPLYAYEWTKGERGAKALVWTNIENIKTAYTIIEDTLDLQSIEKKLVYTSGNLHKVIWYQDSEVTRSRIDLAYNYGVNKFIFWRLGNEDPAIWDIE